MHTRKKRSWVPCVHIFTATEFLTVPQQKPSALLHQGIYPWILTVRFLASSASSSGISGSPGRGLGKNTRSIFSNSGKMSGRLLGAGVSHSCSRKHAFSVGHSSLNIEQTNMKANKRVRRSATEVSLRPHVPAMLRYSSVFVAGIWKGLRDSFKSYLQNWRAC